MSALGSSIPVARAVTSAPISTVNRAMAVASLRMLSPSTSRVRRPGAPISRKIATTAAGSVVATIAPSSRQPRIGTPNTAESPRPIEAVVSTTATTASSRMGAMSSTSRRTSMVSAVWNSSNGRKMVMTVWLSILR